MGKHKRGRPAIPIKYEVDKNGCWHCTSHIANRKGYPQKRRGGETHSMARWILMDRGVNMEGLDAMHDCDNPRCINPNHISAGTRKQNMKDAVLRGRLCKKLTIKEVIKIYETNGLQRDLAIEHGVSQPIISLIKNKLRWGHVTESQI